MSANIQREFERSKLSPVVLAFIALVCSSAQAQNWTYVAATADGAEFYVDKTTIRPQSRFIKAWTREIYKEALHVAHAGGPSSMSLSKLVYYDCKNAQSAIKQQVFYEGNTTESNVVQTWSIDEPRLRFDDEVPGSVGEHLLRFFCAGR